MKHIVIIGAGSFGTSLGCLLAKKGSDVLLWGRNQEYMAEMEASRENTKYLPGVTLPEGFTCTGDIEIRNKALEEADVVLYAVPAQSFRQSLEDTKACIGKGTIIVNVAKGIEMGTLLTMSQVASDVMGDASNYVALSGPSHAEEVGRDLPTSVVAASKDSALAQEIQDLFMTDRFRVYTSKDILGVELGGALKNIIALDAGISDGVGYGDNTKAALMTRGMAEITRLGVAMGAQPETFAGLTGMGDLIVTCTSMHSRNRRCGILLGQGMPVAAATERIGMVVESITTVEATYALAEKMGVEMPITELTHKIIEGKVSARMAVELLMNRAKKDE